MTRKASEAVKEDVLLVTARGASRVLRKRLAKCLGLPCPESTTLEFRTPQVAQY